VNIIYNKKKNAGQHMKTEKYKKMFSKMFSGERNPNHVSNTTVEQRKSRSPFSKDFIKYKDVENVEQVISEFAKNAVIDRLTTNQIDYWLNKGYNEQEARELVTERQRTFTLDKCIEKHGEEEGKKRFKQRQISWQISMLENGNNSYCSNFLIIIEK
jgi:hypothetical protein